MKEITKILNFLNSTGVPYSVWTEPQFIDEDSVKKGAIISISIRDSAHLNFNKDGYLVGSSTDSVKSHILRKVKK
jgi:hypothetical protein